MRRLPAATTAPRASGATAAAAGRAPAAAPFPEAGAADFPPRTKFYPGRSSRP